MGKNVPVPEGDGGDGNLQHLTHRRDDGARERSEIRDGVKMAKMVVFFYLKCPKTPKTGNMQNTLPISVNNITNMVLVNFTIFGQLWQHPYSKKPAFS